MIFDDIIPQRWPVRVCKFFVASILVICFTVHVRESVTKFLGRQTTIALSSENMVAVGPPPSISFCPGFRPEYWLEGYHWLDFLDVWNGTATADEILLWWHSLTFNFTEVVPFIAYPDYAKNLIPSDIHFPGMIEDSNINVTIKEMSTSHGRCYTIDFDCQLKQKEYITLYITLPVSGKMVIFAHERHNEIGIDFGYWPIKPMTLVLQPRDLVSLIFHKNHIMKRKESQCSESNGYSYPRCIQNWAKMSYKHLGRNENITSCWYPQGQYLADGLNLPPCNSRTDYSRASKAAKKTITDNLDNNEVTGCRPSCNQVRYRMEKVEQPTFEHYSYAELYIYMSGVVETSEEYLLFDANAIVASVGGSLGLFLGVSCITFFNVILERISAWKV